MSTTKVRMIPASTADVGRAVMIKTIESEWKTRILARIIVKEEDEETGVSPCVFVCWCDDVDSDGPESSRTEEFREAFTVGDDNNDCPTAEMSYVVQARLIKDIQANLQKEKAFLDNIEKVLAEDWAMSSTTKKQVSVGGRIADLSIENVLCCNILAANRGAVQQKIEEYGFEGLVVTSVSTPKLKSWMKENATVNPDGSLDVSFMPADMQDLVSVFQYPRMKCKTLGIRNK